jgi:Holliday junction resolvasome RuvABC ATP-dependent DNA helicase subunit
MPLVLTSAKSRTRRNNRFAILGVPRERLAISNAPSDSIKVDELGLEQLDREYLSMITQKFGGGPVGLDTLSTAIGEDRGTLEDMIEPFFHYILHML